MTILPNRSSRPRVFFEKSVLKNFAELIEKHLCQSLFFNKFAGLRSAILLKKRLLYKYFLSVVKFLSTLFFVEHLRWILLNQVRKETYLENIYEIFLRI